ncbi:MAG TPA: dihydrofolate reductase family protein [Candidatus Paceibacterota bacterium]|nr:dihydrofolate reductase family protein [Candidatus Paceibacterota bacterium]
MRKIIVLSFVSLDGVMQAPGGPREDASGDFVFGGWTVPYFDEFMGGVMGEQMGGPFDLLLGRKTYDIFASYWPKQDETANPAAGPLNRAKKHVASRSPIALSWENSELLPGDAAEAVRRLKAGDGPDLQVHGSANFIQTLLKNDLVDELWLKIFPVALGTGKRLFAEGTIPAAFTLRESKTSPHGVIVATYVRSGDIKTGTF